MMGTGSVARCAHAFRLQHPPPMSYLAPGKVCLRRNVPPHFHLPVEVHRLIHDGGQAGKEPAAISAEIGSSGGHCCRCHRCYLGVTAAAMTPLLLRATRPLLLTSRSYNHVRHCCCFGVTAVAKYVTAAATLLVCCCYAVTIEGAAATSPVQPPKCGLQQRSC